MNTYVYIVKQVLLKKNPKMPDQACANGLKLDDIPQDLSQLLTIERRLILSVTIYNYFNSVMIQRTLQSKWTTH